MSDRRVSYWCRWPDPEQGPLWAGVHLNERGGQVVAVGAEIWTEPPGDARSDFGPAADPVDDLRPYPPTRLRAGDVHALNLTALLERCVTESPDLVVAGGAPGGGRSLYYGPEHYVRVAGQYRRALEAGDDRPHRAIARHYAVSEGTVRRWLARCRRDGQLTG